jgi:chorismate mutase
LNLFRKELDLIDSNIIDILGDRMVVAEGIGKLKHQENVAILQSGRWSDILSTMVESGLSKGLSKEFVEEVFRAIHVESINIQHKTK